MSFVNVSPGLVASAAQNVAGIGSAVDLAHAAAAPATTSVAAAAGDQVSAAIAAVFSGHGQAFQAASAQAAQFHTEFVSTLSRSGAVYAGTEAALQSQLQPAAVLPGGAYGYSPDVSFLSTEFSSGGSRQRLQQWLQTDTRTVDLQQLQLQLQQWLQLQIQLYGPRLQQQIFLLQATIQLLHPAEWFVLEFPQEFVTS